MRAHVSMRAPHTQARASTFAHTRSRTRTRTRTRARVHAFIRTKQRARALTQTRLGANILNAFWCSYRAGQPALRRQLISRGTAASQASCGVLSTCVAVLQRPTGTTPCRMRRSSLSSAPSTLPSPGADVGEFRRRCGLHQRALLPAVLRPPEAVEHEEHSTGRLLSSLESTVVSVAPGTYGRRHSSKRPLAPLWRWSMRTLRNGRVL